MCKQILLCVETSRKAGTDKTYIDETIERFYSLGNGIRKRYIYLNGKSNYNKPSVIKSIRNQEKQYSPNGPTIVIYCIDTDRYDSEPSQKMEIETISQYCKDNDYEMIWFCRDIEDVYWGGRIPNDKKTSKAAQFKSSKRINTISENKLAKDKFARHHSNIITVLDRHIERKNND